MMDISEKNFEATIEGLAERPVQRQEGAAVRGEYLRAGRLPQAVADDYNRALCLDADVVLDFIYATQPTGMGEAQAAARGGREAPVPPAARLGDRQAWHLGCPSQGHQGLRLQVPVGVLPPGDGLERRDAEALRSQPVLGHPPIAFSEKNEQSIDMVLFLNGLPIFTPNSRTRLRARTVQDAIRQYRASGTGGAALRLRSVPRPLRRRSRPGLPDDAPARRPDPLPAVQHGAQRRRRAIRRLAKGFATAYLWEQTWSRDSVLDLVQNFVQIVEEEDDKGKKTGKMSLLFPATTSSTVFAASWPTASENGTGQVYLIQHSAGSGKSNSIAWLAHQLSTLHDADSSGSSTPSSSSPTAGCWTASSSGRCVPSSRRSASWRTSTPPAAS